MPPSVRSSRRLGGASITRSRRLASTGRDGERLISSQSSSTTSDDIWSWNDKDSVIKPNEDVSSSVRKRTRRKGSQDNDRYSIGEDANAEHVPLLERDVANVLPSSSRLMWLWLSFGLLLSLVADAFILAMSLLHRADGKPIIEFFVWVGVGFGPCGILCSLYIFFYLINHRPLDPSYESPSYMCILNSETYERMVPVGLACFRMQTSIAGAIAASTFLTQVSPSFGRWLTLAYVLAALSAPLMLSMAYVHTRGGFTERLRGYASPNRDNAIYLFWHERYQYLDQRLDKPLGEVRSLPPRQRVLVPRRKRRSDKLREAGTPVVLEKDSFGYALPPPVATDPAIPPLRSPEVEKIVAEKNLFDKNVNDPRPPPAELSGRTASSRHRTVPAAPPSATGSAERYHAMPPPARSTSIESESRRRGHDSYQYKGWVDDGYRPKDDRGHYGRDSYDGRDGYGGRADYDRKKYGANVSRRRSDAPLGKGRPDPGTERRHKIYDHDRQGHDHGFPEVVENEAYSRNKGDQWPAEVESIMNQPGYQGSYNPYAPPPQLPQQLVQDGYALQPPLYSKGYPPPQPQLHGFVPPPRQLDPNSYLLSQQYANYPMLAGLGQGVYNVAAGHDGQGWPQPIGVPPNHITPFYSLNAPVQPDDIMSQRAFQGMQKLEATPKKKKKKKRSAEERPEDLPAEGSTDQGDVSPRTAYERLRQQISRTPLADKEARRKDKVEGGKGNAVDEEPEQQTTVDPPPRPEVPQQPDPTAAQQFHQTINYNINPGSTAFDPRVHNSRAAGFGYPLYAGVAPGLPHLPPAAYYPPTTLNTMPAYLPHTELHGYSHGQGDLQAPLPDQKKRKPRTREPGYR